MMTFKQINPFIAKVRTQMHIRHLSWMKRFDSRVSACITELGEDTPAMLSQAYTALHAASGKAREISPLMYILTVLFVLKYALI